MCPFFIKKNYLTDFGHSIHVLIFANQTVHFKTTQLKTVPYHLTLNLRPINNCYYMQLVLGLRSEHNSAKSIVLGLFTVFMH